MEGGKSRARRGGQLVKEWQVPGAPGYPLWTLWSRLRWAERRRSECVRAVKSRNIKATWILHSIENFPEGQLSSHLASSALDGILRHFSIHLWCSYCIWIICMSPKMIPYINDQWKLKTISTSVGHVSFKKRSYSYSNFVSSISLTCMFLDWSI